MKKIAASLIMSWTLAASVVGSPSAALAGHVVLTPKSGGFDFDGELKSFDGESFVLETPVGSMKLPAGGFDCKSGDCPAGTQRAADTKPAAPAGPAMADHFTIFGATSIGDDLIPGLIRAFGQSRGELGEEVFRAHTADTHFYLYKNRDAPTVEVDIHRYGTAHGFAALAKGDATIAMAGRAITQEEIDQLAPQPGGGPKYAATVVALDAVAVLVSPKRNLTALTLAQLGGIFSGKITDWSQLGLEPGPINLYAPDAGNGTLDVFTSLVLAPQGLAISPLASRMDDFPKMSDLVTADPNAIAIASMAFQRESRALAIKGTCGIVTPLSPFTVKSEEYPMAHRSYLYTAGPEPQIATDFIHFALGNEAQTTVADKQFVNQTLLLGESGGEAARVSGVFDPKLPPPDRALLKRLATDLANSRRLSVTVRFASGTSRLDDRARDDVGRLATWMKAPANVKAAVLVAGFTDQLGGLNTNVMLSQQRAEQVRQAVLDAGGGGVRPEQIVARGYGPAAPVACNSETSGLELNRRVEVWIKN